MNNSSPRVLIIGKAGGILHWPEHLLDACKQSAITHDFFPINHLADRHRIGSRLLKSLSRKKFQAEQLRSLHNKLAQFAPDIVFFIDCLGLTPALQELLAKEKFRFKAAHWIGDYYEPSITELNAFTDIFYFTDTFLIERAKELKLNNPSYLPLAVNDSVFKNTLNGPDAITHFMRRQSPVLFVGAYSANRYDTLNKIDFPLEIYGKGWNKRFATQQKIYPKNISLQKVAQLNANHRCVLNIINKNNICHGLNMRCFEATAAGAVLLTDEVKDLSRCFEAGTEVISYKEVDDLNKKVPALLQSPDVLFDIAVKGQAKTLQYHTYKNRLLQIIAEMNC